MRILVAICFVMPLFTLQSQEMTVFYNEYKEAQYHKLRSSYRGYNNQSDEKTKQEVELINDKTNSQLEDLMDYKHASILRVKDARSIYYPENRMYNDTVNSTVTYGKDGAETFINRETLEKEYKIIYIDQAANQKVSAEYAYGKEYLIEERLKTLNWEMTNETQNLYGYACKKAGLKSTRFISGRFQETAIIDYIIEVWYTEEIKVSNGPVGYFGLPGLIVQVIDGNTLIGLDKIIHTLDGFEIKPPSDGEQTTREGLNDIPMQLFNKH